jgi:hypothetical protein
MSKVKEKAMCKDGLVRIVLGEKVALGRSYGQLVDFSAEFGELGAEICVKVDEFAF